jgi:hypothetical protein
LVNSVPVSASTAVPPGGRFDRSGETTVEASPESGNPNVVTAGPGGSRTRSALRRGFGAVAVVGVWALVLGVVLMVVWLGDVSALLPRRGAAEGGERPKRL